MRQILKVVGLLCVASLFCSCASTSLVDTWRNPNIRPARLQKVLVVSITKKDSSRKVYEEILAGELSRRGVQAVTSYSLITDGERGNWTVLEKAVQRSSAQAVLTLQTIKVERQTTIQPSYIDPYPGRWYPEAFPTWDLYGYYGSMAHYGPAYVSTYDVATMQVNLFDASSRKLLWAATLETSEPENVTSVGKDLSRKVVDSLVKAGLI